MLILDRGKNIEERANVKGKVVIGKNVVLSDDSLIRGPDIIGDNTVIQDKTFIGPYTSIGNNCTIKKASIENSIIMDNSNIDTENAIVDSIIGENSVIMNANLLKPAGNAYCWVKIQEYIFNKIFHIYTTILSFKIGV